MLIALNIKNFALIQKLTVDFGEGFNILSGETGAGKSILIDTIDFVLGGKFSKDLIRYGEEKTFVEAIFSVGNQEVVNLLNDYGIENEDILVISRESTILGKSIIKINGRAIVISQLKKIREKLLDIHGQHQNQNLLNKSNHILYLDEFCMEDIKEVFNEFLSKREKYIEIIGKLNKIKGNENREKVADFIKFQIDDIEKAKLKIGEDDALKEEFNLLNNAERISLSLSKSYNYLSQSKEDSSVLDSLSRVISELVSVEETSDKIKAKREEVEEAYFILEEATRDIRDISDDIVYDENELSKINERIYLIDSYKRKYGNSIKDILDKLESLKSEYLELINSEELLKELEEEILNLESILKDLGKKMHYIRKDAALKLEEEIKKELSYVGLEKAIININVKLSENINARGCDEVQFLVSANPGDPLKPLEKVLSGGELSRIMLALKCVFVDKDKIPTLIFDEIDTGISGAIGKRVGEKMYQVATKHQVLCITHLPQIAALSDNHYFVSKKVENDKTFTQIKVLSQEEKIKEIAKMIGGEELSQVSLENSAEMIRFATRKKCEILKKS